MPMKASLRYMAEVPVAMIRRRRQVLSPNSEGSIDDHNNCLPAMLARLRLQTAAVKLAGREPDAERWRRSNT